MRKLLTILIILFIGIAGFSSYVFADNADIILWKLNYNTEEIHLNTDADGLLISNSNTAKLSDAFIEGQTSTTPSMYLNNGLHASGTSQFEDILVNNGINTNSLTTTDTLYVGTDLTVNRDLQVNGNAWINGYASTTRLQVGASAPAGFSGTGDIWASDSIKADGGLFSEAKPYGASVEALNNNHVTISNNILNGDATLTASTQIIYDSHASFGTPTSTYEGAFIRVVSSAPSFAGAVGEITNVVNNEQVVVSFGTAGNDEIVDATDMSYVVYEAPVFFAGDNGYINATLGDGAESGFYINVPDGRSFSAVTLDDVAGADQHQALTVNVDSQGYDGIVALNLFMQNASSTNPSDGVLEVMASFEGNANNYLNSSLRFMDFNLIGTGTDNDVDIMHINNFPLTSHIIHSGNPNDLERAYYDNGDGTTIDSTTAFNSTGINITLFENDNSIIYIAGATDTEFTNIAFDISTESQRNIKAEYYYCDGDDSWKVLTGVKDTTDGFKVSGSINFMNPVDRGQCNEEIDSTAFADTDARSYIAIKRTRSNNWTGQKPIENLVSISGGGSYLYMDSYGLKPVGSAGAPYTCDASVAGMTYYDSTSVALLWCTGTAWTEFAETADITVHNNLSGIQGGASAEYYHLDSADYTELTDFIAIATLTSTGGMTLNSATTTDSLTVGGKFNFNSEDFTDLTGTNLENDGGRLDVIDSPTFTGKLTTNSDLQVDGNATTTGSLYVGGDLTVAGDTTVVDIVVVNTTSTGSIYVTNDLGLNSEYISQWSDLSTYLNLSDYLTLSDWYATTTDQLTEGITNLYWTQTRWDDAYNSTTTLNGFTDNSTNWDTAYGWGDWSGQGFITGNVFDQWLDTTSTPQFHSVTTTDSLYVGGKLNIDTGITDVLKATAGVVSEVGSPVKNYTLLWNGTAPVWAAQGTSFTFSVATFTDNATASQEIGTGDSIAIGGISFSATYNNGPATSGSVQIQSGTTAWASALELTGGSYLGPTTNTEAVTYPAAPGATVRFRLTSGDGVDSDTSDTTIVYNNNRFWGITTKTDTFTEADVEGLAGSELSNSKDKTFSNTTGVGEYILWASRVALGTVSFSVDGFSGGFQAPETVSITNASGFTEDYYVYRSTNSNLGTITVIAD